MSCVFLNVLQGFTRDIHLLNFNWDFFDKMLQIFEK